MRTKKIDGQVLQVEVSSDDRLAFRQDKGDWIAARDPKKFEFAGVAITVKWTGDAWSFRAAKVSP